MTFPQFIGAPRAVEVDLLTIQMEPFTTTTMELVRLRTRVSVKTSQVKMDQDMQGVLVSRSFVILNAGMENV